MTAEAQAPSVKERAKPGRRSSWLLLVVTILLALAAGVAYTLDMGLWSIPGLETESTQEPSAAVPTTPIVAETTGEREAALALAEDALREREAYVKEQELQVSELLKGLLVQQSDQRALGRVAELYALMPPSRAALALQAMETQLAVQILQLLANEETAAILSMMESERSAEMLTRLAQDRTTETQAKN